MVADERLQPSSVVLQCALAGALAAGGLAFWRLSPALESPVTAALLVEQRNQLHQELVGALQLDGAQGDGLDPFGQSLSLRRAVAARADSIATTLDWRAAVLDGERSPWPLRLALVGGLTLAVVVALSPVKAGLFCRRVFGAEAAYPRRTLIDSLAIGGALWSGQNNKLPSSSVPPVFSTRQALRWTVRVQGAAPPYLQAELAAPDQRRRNIVLRPLERAALEDRLDRLRQAADAIAHWRGATVSDAATAALIADLLQPELPSSADLVRWQGDVMAAPLRLTTAAHLLREIERRQDWLKQAGEGRLYEALWQASTAGEHSLRMTAGDAPPVSFAFHVAQPPRLQVDLVQG